MQRLLAAKRDLRLAAELKRLDRFEALILDDLGYVQQDREEMEVLFTLAAKGSGRVRYRRGTLRWLGSGPVRYRRAVFSLIPARMAAVESGVPVPSSIISLLTCRSVTIRPPW